MIEVKHLTKRYGANLALDDVSFTVKEGEILGFLGPNGAGKSTTMNILTGYLSATEGTVTIGGQDILENPNGAKAQIGYLPEQPPLYLDMTVRAYLNFMCELKKVKQPHSKHIKEVCALVGIEDVYNRLIKNLSKGYRQRVGLAQALLGNPPVLILDEPTIGLDPKQIIEIRNLIKKLGQGHTVILSSHILPEVQAVCQRVIVINKGKLVADDTTSNLSFRMSKSNKLKVRIAGPKEQVLPLLESIPDVVNVSVLDTGEEGALDYSVEAKSGSDIRRDMFESLARENLPIYGLKSQSLSLEDIFLQLTNDAYGYAAVQQSYGTGEGM